MDIAVYKCASRPARRHTHTQLLCRTLFNTALLRARHLSTSELDVDVQPTYVRVTVRGRVLQLVLNELVRGGRELRAQEATSQRSLTTGHLLVCIPFVRSYERRLSNDLDFECHTCTSSHVYFAFIAIIIISCTYVYILVYVEYTRYHSVDCTY